MAGTVGRAYSTPTDPLAGLKVWAPKKREGKIKRKGKKSDENRKRELVKKIGTKIGKKSETKK